MTATAVDIRHQPAALKPASPTVFFEVQQFLNHEAYLLDTLRLRDWTGLLATDLSYRVPVRQTRDRATFGREISDTVCHMEDDYESILGRVSRLVDGKSAWSEDPPSRVRRFVTNVAVGETETADEFEVVSYLLVARNRFDQETYQLLCAERRDRIRRDGHSFKLARRDVLVDQAVLGMPNLGIFL
ncbi:MAG: hypothetical protein JWM78_3784 [Verrucomicrobiaceae bacterium]|nr:hypothetical protein [Verrucomicrobiaceae bacterium]